MTTDNELRALIALGEKATARPWVYGTDPDDQSEIERGSNPLTGKELKIIAVPGDGSHIMGIWANGKWGLNEYYEKVDINGEYLTSAANLAPAIAAELIEAREALALANADAERLASRSIAHSFEDDGLYFICSQCDKGGREVDKINHKADCPLVLHRARVGGAE